jgi:hypothetical protein
MRSGRRCREPVGRRERDTHRPLGHDIWRRIRSRHASARDYVVFVPWNDLRNRSEARRLAASIDFYMRDFGPRILRSAGMEQQLLTLAGLFAEDQFGIPVARVAPTSNEADILAPSVVRTIVADISLGSRAWRKSERLVRQRRRFAEAQGHVEPDEDPCWCECEEKSVHAEVAAGLPHAN